MEEGAGSQAGFPKTIKKSSTERPVLPGGQSEREPPDPIPTSEVKPLSADDSVDPHAKVGNCQAPNPNPLDLHRQGVFIAQKIQRT